MRVITGNARGRKLEALPGLETRPTSDMAKETMFNIIHFEIEGARVLDLFAGTGQLGIEALSREATFATFVDNSREAQQVILNNLKNTKLFPLSRVLCTDFKSFLAGTNETFDVVFLDPPYGKKLIDQALPLVVDKMSSGGVILCETDKTEELPQQVGAFAAYREYRCGKTKVTVYRNNSEEQ